MKGIDGTPLCPYSKKAPKAMKGGGSTMQAARVARRNKLMRTVDIMVKNPLYVEWLHDAAIGFDPEQSKQLAQEDENSDDKTWKVKTQTLGDIRPGGWRSTSSSGPKS